MKKLARLALFFGLSFATLFVLMTGLRFLALRLDWTAGLPGQAEARGGLVAAARWALSLALYAGVLLGLAYASIERVFAPLAILCVSLLALGFVSGVAAGLEVMGNAPAAVVPNRALGGPGLILSDRARPDGAAVVLLRGPDEPAGSRVTAAPGNPMVFGNGSAAWDRAPAYARFDSDAPAFLGRVAADLRVGSETLRLRMGEGLPSFLLYAGALVFLLGSLMFVFRLSAWPLANLFLGLLAFRGTLALEALFNSRYMQEVFSSFLQGRAPVSVAVPAIFVVIGLFAHLYSFLAHFARRQVRYAAA